MKCQFCNAIVKPKVSPTGIKYCPKCELIIGGPGVKSVSYDKPKADNTIVTVSDRPFTKEDYEKVCGKPKDKKGKYQPHLVLSTLIQAVARVREYGVKKYVTENGWKLQTPEDYLDAVGRHYNACRNNPRSRDEESGLLHIALLATDAMFVIDMLVKAGENIDTMKEPNDV